MDSDLQLNLLHAHYVRDLTATDYLVAYKNIAELIKYRYDECPEEEYLVFYEDDGSCTRYTYKEFIELIYSLAAYMQSLNISKEDRVAAFSHNHSDTVLLYFACWCISAVIVPINVNEEEERIKYIIENSNTKVIFTRNVYLEKLESAGFKNKSISFESLKLKPQYIIPDAGYNFDKECEAMIVYTSGTTGNPKGVVLTQYNLMVDAKYIAEWHNIKEKDVMMCVLPIHHVNGTIVTIMTSMYAGAKLVLNQRFQTGKFFEKIQNEKVKIVSVVPTLLQFLLHSSESAEKYSLSHFGHIICGAGPLTCELAQKFEEKFGLRIVHGYGLSETTCYSCFIPIDLSIDKHKEWQNDFGYPSIGIPLHCNDMDIHNEQGQPLNENEKGEIVIRGHNVMKYYFNNEKVNRSTFEFGWFRSGDEGFFKFDRNGNKYFFITGRLKELIIRGGVNISPLEIDEVLCSAENVQSAIAVGFDNDWYGEEVGALILLKPEYQETDLQKISAELLQYYQSRLPFHKAPKVVVISNSIPVTSTGKYQRNKVKHLFSRYKSVQFKELKSPS